MRGRIVISGSKTLLHEKNVIALFSTYICGKESEVDCFAFRSFVLSKEPHPRAIILKVVLDPVRE